MKTSRNSLYLTLFAVCGWGLFSCQNKAQKVESEFLIRLEPKEEASKAHIRGLFLVDDNIGWASGAGGTFLRMTDGENWSADTIAGYTHLDFRDVHGFDANTALLMAAGEEGRILRTDDGGVSWVEVYTRLDSGIFLDGMDFHNNVGYCYGDPIDGKFVLVFSDDFGKHWEKLPSHAIPNSLPNEAGFAASGTGILTLGKMSYIATGGGATARIMRTSLRKGNCEMFDTPLRSAEGCGIFSLTAANETLVALGGCYLDSTNAEANCAISKDAGETWELITENQPRGYRSCVAYSQPSNLLIACGRTGMEYSLDEGLNWMPVSDEGYYTCSLADSTGWVMGKSGKMAKLSW
ncbi:MAG: photosystem II stability/assembly factor-like uncharacterized protein [Bacteroidia bacterium]|jgi:photosystem II stability/assembly factor-like uncharacterized protein